MYMQSSVYFSRYRARGSIMKIGKNYTQKQDRFHSVHYSKILTYSVQNLTLNQGKLSPVVISVGGKHVVAS